MKARFLLFCFLFSSLLLPAKFISTDSMKNILLEHQQLDKLRAYTIYHYTQHYLNLPIDSLNMLYNQAFSYAIANKDTSLVHFLVREKTEYFCRHDPRKGFLYCQEIQAEAERTKDTALLAEVYFNKGVVFKYLNMMDKAIPNFEQSKTYWDKTTNKSSRATAVFILGYCQFNKGYLAKALENFKEAYAYHLKYNNSDLPNLAELSGWIGNTYREFKQYDSALYYRRLALEYTLPLHSNYDTGEALRYIGQVYMRMGAPDSALSNFLSARTLFFKSGNTSRPWLVQTFIAETYANKKDFASAAKELDGILDKKNNVSDAYVLLVAYELGTKVYEQNNELKKALACFHEFNIRNKAFEKADQKQSLAELDSKLKFENEEKMAKMKEAEKDAKLKQERERQAWIRNAFIAGFCILGIFFVFMYRNYLQKKKTNLLLERQNLIIEEKQKDILDSIHYAKRIQRALITSEVYIEKHLKRLMKRDV